jgi:hypothetical protein
VNKFLLIKCMVLGALSFPTPFLIYFYVFGIYPTPNDYFARFFVVIFLILSGGLVGTVYYYRDSAMDTIKDWFPSGKQHR